VSISVQELLTQKARKFGKSEAADDFQQIFLDAFNYVLDDLENRAQVSTDRITYTYEEVDLDKQLYSGTLSIGLDYYIQLNHQYSTEDLNALERRYEDKLRTANMVKYKSDGYGVRFGEIS